MRGLDVLFHSNSYSFCTSVSGAAATYTVKPCSCNCTRHIFAFLIFAVCFSLFPFCTFSLFPKSFSPFFSSFYDSTTQSHVIRCEYVSLCEIWRRIVDCEMRSTSYRWRDFVIRSIVVRLGPIVHGPILSTKLFFFNG